VGVSGKRKKVFDLEGGVINNFRHLIIKKILPSPRRRGVGGEVLSKCLSTLKRPCPF
jgi:hypothetical protein